MRDPDRAELLRIARRVWATLATAGFAGSDPYDGLNSRLLAPVLGRSRLLRLAVIQGVKRSPLDLRSLLRIPPGLNPKGLALILQSAAELPQLGDTAAAEAWLADALFCLASRPDGTPALGSRAIRPGAARELAAAPGRWPAAVGWGYDFPWQSKAFLQPAWYPTVVATSFVLDALRMAGTAGWPLAAVGAGNFVADHLHRHEDADGLCFSYSPGDRTRVYNASLFGARILAQAARHSPRGEDWRHQAARAVDWVVARQAADGSWIYGEAAHWGWIDNLHTGFNLETIRRTALLLGTDRWDESLARGLRYYRLHLFEADGTPRYYDRSRWPLDPHSFAQGALTFLRLARFDPDGVEFSGRILARGVAELWDERRGGFRFQKHRHHTQGIIHLRWSQAWMLRALCAYLAAA
ncbi:MAG: hypothetical protein ACYDIE_04915 [Candidatus Krumholzibacteriia bacterium]